MRGYVMHGPVRFDHASAGVRAWFTLAFALAQRGFDVEWMNSVDAPDRIAVYCDTTAGNPLASRRVVRWMLYYPDRLGIETGIGANETLFAWDDAFCPGATLLQVDVIDRDLFYPGVKTCPAVYYVGKGALTGVPITLPADAVEITHDWPPTREELAALLRSAETFYTFDANTTLSDEAHACGCHVVLPGGAEFAPAPEPDYAAMLEQFIRVTQALP